MRRRRKIRYYEGPSSTVRLTQRPWFPFAAVAAGALVLALVLGAILGAVASDSKRERPVHHDLADFGGVEQPFEKYGRLSAVSADLVDPAGMSESELKKALSHVRGNAVGILLYDGNPHCQNGESAGYEELGSIEALRMAELAEGKSLYSIGYFYVGSFKLQDRAARAYERGREMSLLAELAAAGFGEIMLIGLPTDSSYVHEVNLYIAELRSMVGNTNIGVTLPGESTDAELASLIGVTESHTDAYALDLRGLSNAEAADVIERNAYFVTQYAMRVMLVEYSEAAEAYDIDSILFFN